MTRKAIVVLFVLAVVLSTPAAAREEQPVPRMFVNYGVIEVGDLLVVDVYATVPQDYDLWMWDGVIWWDRPLKILDVRYFDDLWPSSAVASDPPVAEQWWVELGQSGTVPARTGERLIARLFFEAKYAGECPMVAFLHFNAGRATSASRDICVQWCWLDSDGDGRRTVFDWVPAYEAIGCRCWEDCYFPCGDIDGDCENEYVEYKMIKDLWHEPCGLVWVPAVLNTVRMAECGK